ncbi:MAG TPA: pyruvate formate lyase family protein [Desulfitobacteriaceae bacterium]|nr:pyruvate formate lyase family protein [Desulfitobacteriaceae bacterium]
MAIVMGQKKVEEIGAWQEVFEPTCSDRVKKAKARAVEKLEVCLERSRAEIKAYEQYKDEPRIIQRARVFETYLREKTILIMEDELIVGNVTSKHRASPISAEYTGKWMDIQMDDPVKDWTIRKLDRHKMTPEERKELREVIFPYWKGKTFEDYCYSRCDEESKKKGLASGYNCPHVPVSGDLQFQKDLGHQMASFEKVLTKGFQGIKEEAEWYMAQLDQPHMQFGVQPKKDFYKACIIAIDAVMDFAKRYAKLAREMANKEVDPRRKRELNRIAEVCDHVPANPARDWWEAVQTVWFVQMLTFCEMTHVDNNFGRFDQYMYPFYKKTVLDEKKMTRDEALELVECLFVKASEFAQIWSYEVTQIHSGHPLVQTLDIGGQTRDGKDACNEVTMLVLDAEEQVGLIQPDIAMLLWEGTPEKYLRRAAEIVRLGRGKPKFFSSRTVQKILAGLYPDLTIEDYREGAVKGCFEPVLPGISQCNGLGGMLNITKLFELVLNNGKCPLCGEQIGPETGDPRAFKSIADVQQAFKEQVYYWGKLMIPVVKTAFECEAERSMIPYSSSIVEGTFARGRDLAQGGAPYTFYAICFGGPTDIADSFGVIDTLIYKEKKITWDQLLEALKANWEGHEELRQLCINGVPKYGNDNDYADQWQAWCMDVCNKFIDWVNTQADMIPYPGGKYINTFMHISLHVALGYTVGSLPNGHVGFKPLGDSISPVQGMDKKGPTAVLKSVGKLPNAEVSEGCALNQRLSPQLLATDRDIDNFVAYLRAFEELGIEHLQVNVVSSDLLRKAMKDPEEYKDLIIRVAAYSAYFIDLDESTQLDIINRTEQNTW